MSTVSLAPEPVQVSDLRATPRFLVIATVKAAFNGQAVRLIDVGVGGLQLEHSSFVRLGTRGVVLVDCEDPFQLHARIVWSRLSAASTPPAYRSGARLEGDLDSVAGRLGRFVRAYGRADTNSLARKVEQLRIRTENRKVAMKYIPVRSERADDDTMLIHHARQQLSARPDEALKWYNRAKFALADRVDIAAELSSVPYRHEALAVWEYLERRIDIVRIIATFEASRR